MLILFFPFFFFSSFFFFIYRNRHFNEDGSVVYTSNTGKTTDVAPPGFEEALAAAENKKAEEEAVQEETVPEETVPEETVPEETVEEETVEEEIQLIISHTVEETPPVEEEVLGGQSATTSKALYEYAAAGDNQTSLKLDEIVVVLEADSGGWTGVQSSTGAGFVPSSYLTSDFTEVFEGK